MNVTRDEFRERPAQTHNSNLLLNSSEVFEAVFLENWPRIHAYLIRLVGDVDHAEDLAMETFWKMYQRPPRDRNNLPGWLYRVATNLGLNALRSQKRRQHYEEQVGRSDLQDDKTINPAEELEHAEQRQQVRQVLATMKPRSAQLLLLRHAGLSYAEVAAAMKIKPSSIGKLLARAEEEFERLYRQMYPGG